MAELTLTISQPRRAYRIAVSFLFFLQGICFASWASRIPSIQQNLQLSNGILGIVLFALPVGSMLALPFAGWLVSRFGSKKTATLALILYSTLLLLLGLAQNIIQLVTILILYGMAGNTANIAINTQAVGVEAKYNRSIMASFHGLWSLAGFTAAGIGTIMIGQGILPTQHFTMVMVFILLGVTLSFNYLINDEEKNTASQKLFVKPDKSLINLGIIAFCCMICEGAMFDWSGIYFKKVVEVDPNWIGAGYTAFMSTMAIGRFIADWTTSRVGFKRTIQLSGCLIATGLLIAVIFPYLISSVIGFLLVGFGVSSVVPLVYSEAGKSKTLSAGAALAAVSSIGFLGFLAGPPLIGIVASIASLRVSFLIIALMGMSVIVIVGKLRNKSN